jgi:hypothetical protein
LSSITIDKSGVNIIGAGNGTVIKAVGDAAQADWYVFHVKSPDGVNVVNDIEIRDLKISGEGMTNTEEQTHLIQIGVGPVSRVNIQNLAMFHPIRKNADGTNQAGGDCIRMLGEYQPPTLDKRISDVTISHVTFIDCDRSSIAVQRAVFGVAVHDSNFIDVGDQAIDFEPTGVGAVARFVLDGLTISGGRQGDIAVAISGNAEGAYDVTLANSIINRGVTLYQARNVKIAGNVISSIPIAPAGVVHIQKASSSVLVTGNSIVRNGAVAGSTISTVALNSGLPGHVLIDGNFISSATDGTLVNIESAQDVTVSDNEINFTGPTANLYNAVKARSVAQVVDGISVTGNRVTGALKSMVDLAASPMAIGSALIVGNMARGTKYGLTCTTTGGAPKPIVYAANSVEGANGGIACGAQVVGQFP